MELTTAPPGLTCGAESRVSVTQKDARECGVRVPGAREQDRWLRRRYWHGPYLQEIASRRWFKPVAHGTMFPQTLL